MRVATVEFITFHLNYANETLLHKNSFSRRVELKPSTAKLFVWPSGKVTVVTKGKQLRTKLVRCERNPEKLEQFKQFVRRRTSDDENSTRTVDLCRPVAAISPFTANKEIHSIFFFLFGCSYRCSIVLPFHFEFSRNAVFATETFEINFCFIPGVAEAGIEFFLFVLRFSMSVKLSKSHESSFSLHSKLIEVRFSAHVIQSVPTAQLFTNRVPLDVNRAVGCVFVCLLCKNKTKQHRTASHHQCLSRFRWRNYSSDISRRIWNWISWDKSAFQLIFSSRK